MVHATLQDWTVDTSGGLNHKQSLNAAQGTEPTFRGNHSYEKHSVVGYEISTGNTECDRTHTPGVLPLTVINTEVGNCNSASGFKTRICNMQFTDRVGFLNKSEDIQDSRCPRLEDKSLSKHIGFKIEIPDWVESHHVNSQLDTSIHSSTNNGDNNLFKILMVVSIFNNSGVKNVKLDSVLKAWRLIKLPMDRIRFIKGNSCNRGLYDSRVLRECFGTNVHSPGSKENQKKPVDVTRDRMDSCTKPEESPDFTTETLWDSLPM